MEKVQQIYGMIALIQELQTKSMARMNAVIESRPELRGLDGLADVNKLAGFNDCIDECVAFLQMEQAKCEVALPNQQIN